MHFALIQKQNSAAYSTKVSAIQVFMICTKSYLSVCTSASLEAGKSNVSWVNMTPSLAQANPTILSQEEEKDHTQFSQINTLCTNCYSIENSLLCMPCRKHCKVWRQYWTGWQVQNRRRTTGHQHWTIFCRLLTLLSARMSPRASLNCMQKKVLDSTLMVLRALNRTDWLLLIAGHL